MPLSWIAHVAFWSLIVWGVVSGELRKRSAAVFVMVWFAAPYALQYLPYGLGLFSSLVAVLDIVLVFMIFKGDVRLT